ncbi:coiled-coil domain-containing protein 103 [Amyelois transitella]|uniref:coiled-coil domain-containing protein 103 n=1 Tax=Amyelois transitella TaxID=680683 RepID=UPI00298F9AC1|nr:coiled-coil domain-containing protein 103 [Amyelois transitella]
MSEVEIYNYLLPNCCKRNYPSNKHQFAFSALGSHSIYFYWPIMDKPLGLDDISAMENQLRSSVEQDRHYWRVNDVKCDAIYTAKTYEEFADRVAAAHLRPLEKADYRSKKSGWNQYAVKEKESD